MSSDGTSYNNSNLTIMNSSPDSSGNSTVTFSGGSVTLSHLHVRSHTVNPKYNSTGTFNIGDGAKVETIEVKKGLLINAQGGSGGRSTEVVNIHSGSRLIIDSSNTNLDDDSDGGVILDTYAAPYSGGTQALNVDGNGAVLEMVGANKILLSEGSTLAVKNGGTLQIDGKTNAHNSDHKSGILDIDHGEILLKNKGSELDFSGAILEFKNSTITDGKNSIKAGSLTKGSGVMAFINSKNGNHITLDSSILSGDITVSGNISLDPKSSIEKGESLDLAQGSTLSLYNATKNTASYLEGSGTLSLMGKDESLDLTGDTKTGSNFSGIINANSNQVEFDGNASLNGATINQASLVIGNRGDVNVDNTTLWLNGANSTTTSNGKTSSGAPNTINIDNGGAFKVGNKGSLNIGGLEDLSSGSISFDSGGNLTFADTASQKVNNSVQKINPVIGLEYGKGTSLHFNNSTISLANSGINSSSVNITGDITSAGDNGVDCKSSACIANTYDHLSIYGSKITGTNLEVTAGQLNLSPDTSFQLDNLKVDDGTVLQLQSGEGVPPALREAGYLYGSGTIQMMDDVTLSITGHGKANGGDTSFLGTITGLLNGSASPKNIIVDFGDVTTLGKGSTIEAVNNVNFHQKTTLQGGSLLGNESIKFLGKTTQITNSKIGVYPGYTDVKPINSGIVWAGYKDISSQSEQGSGILNVTDKSSIVTDEFFVGRTGSDGKTTETVNFNGAGVTADLGQLVVGQASNTKGSTNTGTLNITSGAQVSVDNNIKYSSTKVPGIYVGNNLGSGPDQREASAAGNASGSITVSGSGSSLLIKNGAMYVGSNNKTDSGSVSVKDSGSLSLNNSTLNVDNSGSVYVSGSGILNANASSISLGDAPSQKNIKGSKSLAFDSGLTNGDINIDGGVLNITGNAGAAKFSGEHTGNLDIHNGSTINVGTKQEAGSLNVDGNMSVADDTVSNFYEGDAKPCPTGSTKYSCSHGPSKETNPTDDSIIRVSGNLHLGGTLNISGTGGQSGQFDEGLYTIYTYGKLLSGKFGDVNISSDYLATIYTDHNGEVDVLIWNKNDAPPTIVNGGGNVNWDDSHSGDGSVIIDGNDNGKPKDTNITINDGTTASTPNIIIHSGGTTIHGGSIAGKPSTSKDGDSSKDDSPIHINVNGNDNASGKISSNITDPTKKNSDGTTSHTSIKKDGDGDLVINGGKKSYSGSTDVAGGTLDIGNKNGKADPSNPNDPKDPTADISNSSGTTVDNGGTINVNKGSKTSKITVNGGGTANIDGQTGNIDNKGGTTNINGDDTKNANPKNPNDKDTDNTISNTDGGTVNINNGGKTGKIDSKDSDTNIKKGGETDDIHSDGGQVNVDGKTGEININNGGSANISGDGTAGDITVDGKGGDANVDGHSGKIDATNGGSISGAGNIDGDASVGSGGTIHAGSTTDPNKKDGDLNIHGGLDVAGNSTIDGSSGGTINVDGSTDITGGPVPVHVHVDGNNGCREAGDSCEKDVIHSKGGITGAGNLTPDDVNSGPLVKRKIVITGGSSGTSGTIGVVSSIPTYVVPGTNSGTGSGLEGLSHNSDNNPAAQSILDPLANIDTVSGLKKAYSALSGEINADGRTAMINDGYMLQEAVIQRLDCMNDDLRRKALGKKGIKNNYCTVDPKHHFTLWGRMFGTRGDSFGSGQATMTQSSAGWIVGSDAQIAGTWRVGGILSYGRDWFGAHDIQSTGHSDDISLGMYAGNSWQMNNGLFDAALVLKMGAVYTWDVMHTHRTVAFQGYNGNLSANTLGSTFQGFSELGYKMLFNKHHKMPVEVEPFARLSFINFDTDNYAEHGSTAALNVHGEGTTVGYIDLGVKVASSIPINDGSYFSPHAALSYRGAFGDTNPKVHEEFAAARSGNYDMTINGVPIAANTADLNLGFTVHVDDKIDFDMDYIGQYGSHITSSGGMGTFRYRF